MIEVNNQDFLLGTIREAIQKKLESIVREEIEIAKERANKRMAEAITAISVDLCRWYSVESFKDQIVVTVVDKRK